MPRAVVHLAIHSYDIQGSCPTTLLLYPPSLLLLVAQAISTTDHTITTHSITNTDHNTTLTRINTTTCCRQQRQRTGQFLCCCSAHQFSSDFFFLPPQTKFRPWVNKQALFLPPPHYGTRLTFCSRDGWGGTWRPRPGGHWLFCIFFHLSFSHTFTFQLCLDKPWSQVSSLHPPRFLPSIFIAHRVQQSHCSSIFHRVLLAHAPALSASQFVHKKKSQRIITSMHSAGIELTNLTYTITGSRIT